MSGIDSIDRFIATAEKMLGLKEGTEYHSIMLAIYNSFKPVGEYTMTAKDPWCAAFVGVCAADAQVTQAVPVSAHCDRMISWLQSHGGKKVAVPERGDLAFFNWDLQGETDHVGIVVSVNDYGIVRTIEGNKNDAVEYRDFGYPSQHCRFFRPDWGRVGQVESTPLEISWSKYRDFYKELTPAYQAEIRKFPLLYGGCGGPFVKILQKYLGIKEDGHFGTDTETAVKLYQKKRQLEVDGQVGKQTWSSFFV